MTLLEINQELLKIAEVYPQKSRELREAELRFNLRFWHLLLNSRLGTIAAKEAEANMICNEEGLLEPLQILRADVKALYHRKDCFIEVARNLRALRVGQEVGE